MCCARSSVGASLDVDAMPRSADLALQPLDVQRLCLLAGGDDYELLFTAAPGARVAVRAAAASLPVAVTCIGSIDAAPGLRVTDAKGGTIDTRALASFDHFRT